MELRDIRKLEDPAPIDRDTPTPTEIINTEILGPTTALAQLITNMDICLAEIPSELGELQQLAKRPMMLGIQENACWSDVRVLYLM